MHDILGVQYDAVAGMLTLKPTRAFGEFELRGIPMGEARFDIAYSGNRTTVVNRSAHAVRVVMALPGGAEKRELLPTEKGEFLDL